MKMISIFNFTIPNQLCKERLTPLLSFIIGMKKWIGAAVALLSDCRQKAILPRRGRIALSANERIAEFLDFAIQAKFAYVNKLGAALRERCSPPAIPASADHPAISPSMVTTSAPSRP